MTNNKTMILFWIIIIGVIVYFIFLAFSEGKIEARRKLFLSGGLSKKEQEEYEKEIRAQQIRAAEVDAEWREDSERGNPVKWMIIFFVIMIVILILAFLFSYYSGEIKIAI